MALDFKLLSEIICLPYEYILGCIIFLENNEIFDLIRRIEVEVNEKS